MRIIRFCPFLLHSVYSSLCFLHSFPTKLCLWVNRATNSLASRSHFHANSHNDGEWPAGRGETHSPDALHPNDLTLNNDNVSSFFACYLQLGFGAIQLE